MTRKKDVIMEYDPADSVWGAKLKSGTCTWLGHDGHQCDRDALYAAQDNWSNKVSLWCYEHHQCLASREIAEYYWVDALKLSKHHSAVSAATPISKDPHPCSCPNSVLFSRGCQCGGI